MTEYANTNCIRFVDLGRRKFRNRFFRFSFVLFCWTGGVAAAYLLSIRNPLASEFPSIVPAVESERNPSVLGPIRYILWDPSHGHRPRYMISFHEAFANSGRIGVFKTGLFKTVHVRSLRIRRYEYDSAPDSPEGDETVAPVTGHAEIWSDLELVAPMVFGGNDAMRLGQGMEIQIDRPDFTDAGEIIVEDLDYRVFFEGKQHCAIVGKRALASHGTSGILLRGGVVITAADGTVLRANRIDWNPKKETFTVDGNYLLCRDGIQTAGRTICLDEQLGAIEDVRTVAHNEMSEGTNYAKR